MEDRLNSLDLAKPFMGVDINVDDELCATKAICLEAALGC